MLEVDISKSLCAPMTATAIEASKGIVLDRFKRESYLFRAHFVGADGKAFQKTSYVCTGENTPCEKHKHPDLKAGGGYVFILPIHLGDNVTYSNIKYSGDKEAEEAYRFWLSFCLDDKVSPWKEVLPCLVNRDISQAVDDRSLLFQHVDQLHFKLLQSFLIGLRWPCEYARKFHLFRKHVEAGHHPMSAYFVAMYQNRSYYSGHEALSSMWWRGMVQQDWKVSGESLMHNQLNANPDIGRAGGFGPCFGQEAVFTPLEYRVKHSIPGDLPPVLTFLDELIASGFEDYQKRVQDFLNPPANIKPVQPLKPRQSRRKPRPKVEVAPAVVGHGPDDYADLGDINL